MNYHSFLLAFFVTLTTFVADKPLAKTESSALTYQQQLQVTFKDAETAEKARVTIATLYNGYKWSISSRWDDNNAHNLDMRDALNKHGHKGTFYLNEIKTTRPAVFDQHNASWDFDFKTDFYLDPDYDYGKSREGDLFDFTSTARKLLEGGHSIGGHSLTHPRLAHLNRNRIFEEVAGIRAQWEAAADTLLNSYAFSYCNYRNEIEPDSVHKDIDRALERAGFFHIANHHYDDHLRTDMIISPIMPSDGDDIDKFAQDAFQDNSFARKHPHLSYAMHVWYRTPEMWHRFEQQLEKYAHNPDWWYCNQNQYAAYRYQLRHSKLSTDRNGDTITVTLERPELRELNDPTPITLRIEGASKDDRFSVTCSTAQTSISERATDALMINVFHDRSMKLPGKIGLIENPTNRPNITSEDHDPDFPGLKALLCSQKDQLLLKIAAPDSRAIENLTITWRLPLAFTKGVITQTVGDIPAGTQTEQKLSLESQTDDYLYTVGIAYYVAQIDFETAGHAARLYATCKVRNDCIDRSFPQGGFLKLGPIHADSIQLDKMVADIEAGKLTSQPWRYSWQCPDGRVLDWTLDFKDSPFHRPHLSPELVRTFGRWICEDPLLYFLQSSVHSQKDRPVDFLCQDNTQYIFLNGEILPDKKGNLKKGDNNLVLVYNSRRGVYGALLRLADPHSGRRLTDIRFEPEKAEAGLTGVFKPYWSTRKTKSISE